MKKFSCSCIDEQFKTPEEVYVGLTGQLSSIPCVYRPNGKVTLRQIKLETNYCPFCGERLKEME